MKRFFLGLFITGAWFALMVSTSLVITGCASTNASRVAYTSTEALGKTVDAASQAFTDYEVVRAKAVLGPTADQLALRAWTLEDEAYKHFAELRHKYNVAFTQWCAANALSVTHTNSGTALVNPEFRLRAIQLAGELTSFIANIVGANKVTVVKP